MVTKGNMMSVGSKRLIGIIMFGLLITACAGPTQNAFGQLNTHWQFRSTSGKFEPVCPTQADELLSKKLVRWYRQHPYKPSYDELQYMEVYEMEQRPATRLLLFTVARLDHTSVAFYIGPEGRPVDNFLLNTYKWRAGPFKCLV